MKTTVELRLRRAVAGQVRRLAALGLNPRPKRTQVAQALVLGGATDRDTLVRRLGALAGLDKRGAR